MYSHNKGMVKIPEIFIYENLNVLPRIYVATKVVSADSSEIPVALESDGLSDATYVETPSFPELNCENWRAEIRTSEPNRIAADVMMDGEGLLVFSEIWHSGWSAKVDGEEAEIVKTNGIMRGIFLGPGEHNVTMAFEPAYYRQGLGLAAVTGIVCFLSIGTNEIVRRRKIADSIHN
jgi:hypothetical protein